MTKASEKSADVAAPSPSKKSSFKKLKFVHSSRGGPRSKELRVYRNLKQLQTYERNLALQNLDTPTYTTIDAAPSLKPAKKYSDISGLPANYTDPQTNLRYATKEEFCEIRLLGADIVTGYLALRKAAVIM